VTAEGTCGQFDPTSCTESSDFGDGSAVITVLGVMTGDLIATSLAIPCSSCDLTASTTLVNVTVNGTPVAINPPANGQPIVISGPLGTVSVFLNRQFCDPTTEGTVVQGVYVRPLERASFRADSGQIILAESRVKTASCNGLC
jgi:hypothetical protein